MAKSILGKYLAVFIVLILVFMNLYGVNFGSTTETSNSRSRAQPYNSFRNYNWGGLGEQQDEKYGWNVTYIKNLNGDSYPDLVVGSPWYDSVTLNEVGMVYIFYGKENSAFADVNYTDADVSIRGDGLGFKFGWDVADAGDVNNDGINDLIVGAPGALNGRGRAYIFYGGNIPTGSTTAAAIAGRIVDGPAQASLYGTAVAGAGDVNNDTYDDIIVGAPALDQAIITYGYKQKIKFFPDIWDDNTFTKGVVDFRDGLNNTPSDLNTWGLAGDNDGWDWITNFDDQPANLYGGDDSIDGANLYAPWEDDGPDADGLTYNNQTKLEITVGRTHGGNCLYDHSWGTHPGGSAAWGIEFNITAEMLSYLLGNSSIKLSFTYWAEDTEGFFSGSDDTEEWCAIRSRIWNGSSAADRHYIGYIGDPNDLYVTLNRGGGGTPWGPISGTFEYDITNFIDHDGAYYWDFGCSLGSGRFGDNEGIIAFFDDITMEISNEKSVIIQGNRNSGFGSSVEGIGDIDNDGYPEMLIGAPDLDGGYVALIKGKGKFKSIESANIASIILTGKNDGDEFGFSVSLAGDVDDDGVQDIIIGAPGGDYANLYFGSTLNTPAIVPDLWENINDINTPQVEFDHGPRSTGDTPDISGADDGWDTWNGAYGYNNGGPGTSTRFNGDDALNLNNIENDHELKIAIGRDYGNDARPDSGAYGVKFQATSEMLENVKKGGDVVVSYDWYFDDSGGLDDGDDARILTHIRNATDDFELGWSLDSDQSDYEVFWAQSPEDDNDVFVQGCTEYFQKAGWFYFDLGGKVDNWDTGGWSRENGIFYFDNIHLRFNQPPDIQFIGEPDSGFGYSVGFCDKLNFDDNGDIIIGAPYYDSANGADSGAIFGFFYKLTSGKTIYAKNAEYISYGEKAGDHFGWSLSESVSVDNDDFSEIVTSAVSHDSTSSNIGKIYLLSITPVPRIRVLYPVGGELLGGNFTVNATVIDPDDNIDNAYGVQFRYSTDLITWTTLGDDKAPTQPDNIYEHYWNTSSLPDGTTYYLKGWVRDLDLNIGENITAPFTIDNPHEPEVSIRNPTESEPVEGIVEIRVKAVDSELDNIGGGINTTLGVNFFFSTDSTTWTLLGTETKGTKNIYSVFLDTIEYPDGEYWIKANATDYDGYEAEDEISVFIDNPSRPPSIKLLAPVGVEEVKGITFVRATAFDFDGDINSSGISYYLAPSNSPDDWMFIGNNSDSVKNESGADIYTIEWDTRKVADDWYRLKAFVQDEDNLTNESAISEFKVHNNKENPPSIEIITPKGGEMLKETQMIRVRVRDLEGNIDDHGVDYYYSEDKVKWRYIGVTKDPEVVGSEYYSYLWRTDTVPDGEYWLNATVADDTGLRSWYIPDEPIFIHNSNTNPPFVRVLSPSRGEHINGTYSLQAYALDLENNIDSNGVLFMYSTDGEDWSVLSYSPAPTVQKGTTYVYSWDTTQHPDGRYWIRAEASDFDGLKGFGISDYFFIHNNQNNAPTVTLIHPRSGELSGQVKINATAFDLEKNINDNGMNFYFSTDNSTWVLINSDSSGTPIEEEKLFYELTWDTTLVQDDYYWVKVEAEDLSSEIGNDISGKLIIHNKRTNPPKIELVQPRKGFPLDPIQSIIVDVIDFDDDVESVTFLFSKDNKTWELIDSRLNPEIGSSYKTFWDTEKLYNDDYYLKIVAKDQMGNDEELTAGPFEVTAGKKRADSKTDDFLSSNLLWIIIIIVIVIIMVLLVVMLMRRSKKREKELIEEVSAEMLGTGAMEGEIESVPGMGVGEMAGDQYQSYIPPGGVPEPPAPQFIAGEADVETVESYKAQMDGWKAEGYDVSRLEQLYSSDENMFASAAPIFASNISKLKNISGKLNSMNTTGYEDQVNSLRSKLYSPDQAMAADNDLRDLEVNMGLVPAEMEAAPGEAPALGTAPGVPGTTPELPPIDDMLPQLLPADTSTTPTPDVDGPTETDIPLDVELPPEIDLPPDTGQPTETPSPTIEQPTIAQEPTVATPTVAPETQEPADTQPTVAEESKKSEDEIE
jgi:hypothetical protein